MKKIFLIAAAAIITLSASAQNLKFAHVNLQELVYLSADYESAQKTLAASQKEAQETYQSMVDEFNSKYSEYQQKASTWTATIRETKESELTRIQQSIQEFQQNIQTELSQQESELISPIQQKAIEAVQKLAKDGGYVYVFEVGSLLYVNEAQSTDLTPAARKALGIPEGRTVEDLQAALQALQPQQ
ncbi:MAG: OmpH family outer membrane protein [Bacteroidales bacterium]|jgi:outer membrane protein|nr:OmpH family outer membrane protein [Bacteroidales bacterium]